eukprot:Nitzschia sp. Nitz4//scaffold22_size323478//300808//302055//NITZ4_000591-RA/size323478-processed-gene-0.128-mRNA-1//-1//CDS//3329543189//1435//frame0
MQDSDTTTKPLVESKRKRVRRKPPATKPKPKRPTKIDKDGRERPDFSMFYRKKKRAIPTGPKPKRYVRVWVLKASVIRWLFFGPLAMILFERFLGKVIGLNDVQDAVYQQMGIEIWQLPPEPTEIIGQVPDIINLTATPHATCPSGQHRMMSVDNMQHLLPDNRKIPKFVHQTFNTRCLTENFFRACYKWAFRRYTYRFHDNDALMRVLGTRMPEFPHLSMLLKSECLTPELRMGLWKFVTLWIWGGIVADLNSLPIRFDADTIMNSDEGYFLITPNDPNRLSTTIMAVSPRHPLMYYAVQHSILNILNMVPGRTYEVNELVGEGALEKALTDFRGKKSLRSSQMLTYGTIQGTHERSIRIGGTLGEEEAMVSTLFPDHTLLNQELQKSGRSWATDVTGMSCLAYSNLMKLGKPH